jgi:hypothetical protein
VPKVGEDLALVDGDPSGSKESGVLGLRDEGHERRTGILVKWAETGWLMGESSGRVGWKE